MGTYAQLFVYDVPAGQARALLDTIDADDLDTNAGYRPHPDPGVPGTSVDLTGRLVLGAPGYSHEKVSVGWMFEDDLADELVQAAPGATWRAWECPADGHLGTLRVHVPGLGVFRADCDGDGTPMFSEADMRAVAADPAALDQAIGRPWFNHVAALSAQLGDGESLMQVPSNDAADPVDGAAPAATATVWIVHPHDYTATEDRDVFGDEDTALAYVEALGIKASVVAEPILSAAEADRMIASRRRAAD
jgi:hypothetical protein